MTDTADRSAKALLEERDGPTDEEVAANAAELRGKLVELIRGWDVSDRQQDELMQMVDQAWPAGTDPFDADRGGTEVDVRKAMLELFVEHREFGRQLRALTDGQEQLHRDLERFRQEIERAVGVSLSKAI